MGVTAAQVRKQLQALRAGRAAAARTRAARLSSRLPAAASLLRSRYGARTILLFGSLAREGSATVADVDLAVEGLSPSKYFEALADLMALFGAPVDLVELECAPSSLRERVLAEGMAL